MRGLSLTQPWSSLVINGSKKIETRSWSTAYRGTIAIHAAKSFPRWAKDECYTPVFALHLRFVSSKHDYGYLINELPRGVILGLADIVECVTTNTAQMSIDVSQYEMPKRDTPEFAFGNYEPNRFMWFLENVRALPTAVPCKGALGLWTVPGEIETQIMEQVKE